MAWETRGNNSYLYQKERNGEKVKSVYVGRGEVAFLIDELDNAGKFEKEQTRAEIIRQRELSEAIDEQLNALSEINQSLVDALFLINGFHQHKRQWRKKRNGKNSNQHK